MSYQQDILKFSLENYHPIPILEKVRSVRKVIIQSMNKIRKEFDLHPQTFFIAISLFDKLVEKDWKILLNKKYQFIVSVLLWISSKFEEVEPLYMDDLFYITEHEHSKEEFLEFEQFLLKTIEYKIPHITSYSILEQYKNIYPTLKKKDIFKKCLDTLIQKTYQENISSLSVLELIQFVIN